MYIKEIKLKLKQQRTHLASTCNLLNKQIELKDEIMGLVRHSEEQLHRALQQKSQPADKINDLKGKLEGNQRLYAECNAHIHKFRANTKVIKKEIEKSKLKLHHIIFPKKTSGFCKKKDDHSQPSSSSHQSAHTTHFTK